MRQKQEEILLKEIWQVRKLINNIEKYISELPRFTKKNTPEHTRKFMEYLGNPQENFKVIHVAGTNGKGSVCAYLNAMLNAQGESTGLFISPHLVKINERIVIDNKEISDEDLEKAFDKVMKTVNKMLDEGMPHPAYIEFIYAIGMVAFNDANIKYTVVETGLGGRLDATNIVKRPYACAITNIGYDHMYILGDTIEKIAGEKAGIIKENVPVFYADSGIESNSVIENISLKKHAPFYKIGDDKVCVLGIEDKHIAFSRTSVYDNCNVWKLNNIGSYQPVNAEIAIEIMEFLFKEKGNYELWHKVLENLKWPGRMEEVSNGIYVDGAQNISAVKGFTDTVKSLGRDNIILFSAVDDKDYESMIKYLCENLRSDLYVITKIEDLRGEGTDILKNTFERYTDKPVVVKEDIDSAFKYIESVRNNRNVYCLGSLYLAGMIKRRFM